MISRLYVFPTEDHVPLVGTLAPLAQRRLASMCEARDIDLDDELVFDGDPTRSVCTSDRVGNTSLAARLADDSIRVRATWIRENPLDGRAGCKQFAPESAKAAALGHGWCVESAHGAPEAHVAVAAIAGALAELTNGFLVSWDKGAAWRHTPCFPETLYEFWGQSETEYDPLIFEQSALAVIDLFEERLSLPLNINASTSPEGALYLEFLKRVVHDRRTHIAAVEAFQWPRTVDLLPDSAYIVNGVEILDRHGKPGSGSYSVLAEGDDATYFVGSIPGRSTGVLVAAEDQATAYLCAEDVRDRLPEPEVKPEDPRVSFDLWYAGSRGFGFRTRRLQVPMWADIDRNYPTKVAHALAQLMNVTSPSGRGRLILWHGEPGTGKTTALRALSKQWQSWCEMHYVTDPEVLFSSPEYLDQLLRGEDDEYRDYEGEPDTTKWRLIIAEDSDEFVRANARATAGAALGRLLNVTDGLLGQGTKTLVLLTTNEPLGKLHPAVVRPGRCMAEIGFSKFGALEATAWLGDNHARVDRDLSLAELFELEASESRISAEIDHEMQGLYL